MRKFSAVWLIVLILSPFTAAFSTCDLPDADHAHYRHPDNHSSHRSSASVERAMASPVHALALRTGRTRHLFASALQLSTSLLPPIGSGDPGATLSVTGLRLNSSQPATLRI